MKDTYEWRPIKWPTFDRTKHFDSLWSRRGWISDIHRRVRVTALLHKVSSLFTGTVAVERNSSCESESTWITSQKRLWQRRAICYARGLSLHRRPTWRLGGALSFPVLYAIRSKLFVSCIETLSYVHVLFRAIV